MKTIGLSAFVVFGVLLLNEASAAQTAWQDTGGGRARLSAIVDPATNKVLAAVKFELKPGWKTYWREPGGSGIPPQFDFSKSKHFTAGEVAFPAPQLLKAGDSTFAGYRGETAFFFEGIVIDATSAGSIVLDLLAGVCEEICIPAQMHFELPFSAMNVSDAEAIAEIEQAQAALPGKPVAGWSVTEVKFDGENGLLVSADIASGASPVLFSEGPAKWYLQQSELLSTDDSHAVFRVKIADRPKDGDVTRAIFRFTLVDGNKAIEQFLSPKLH